MKKLLVTGVAGFIGYHFVNRLLDRGYEVVGIDNFDPYYDRSYKERRVQKLLKHEYFSFHEGDLRDCRFLDSIFRQNDIDLVAHFAARAGVRSPISTMITYFELNVKGTLILLDSMRKNGMKKMITASTSSVYAGCNKMPFSEDIKDLKPLSPYAISKLACENYLRIYSMLYGMQLPILRIFTCYGPEQRPDMALHKFAKLITEGKPIELYDKGTPERDFTFVGDTVEFFIRAVERIDTLPRFDIYNVASSNPVTIRYMLKLLERNLGLRAKVVEKPLSHVEPHKTFADNSKAVSVLGYKPAVSIEEGISRFCTWFLNSGTAT